MENQKYDHQEQKNQKGINQQKNQGKLTQSNIGRNLQTQKISQASQNKFLQTKKSQKAERIIKKCIFQNQIFKQWHSLKRWKQFHHAHYDWWAFPIDQNSSYGQQYKIGKQEQQIMKQRPEFIDALKSNAFMVCEAWGWDLNRGQLIQTADKTQSWFYHMWPVRLYKMTRSLQIFQLKQYFDNAIKFGRYLLISNYQLNYGRKDYTKYFEQGTMKQNKKQQINQTQQVQCCSCFKACIDPKI